MNINLKDHESDGNREEKEEIDEGSGRRRRYGRPKGTTLENKKDGKIKTRIQKKLRPVEVLWMAQAWMAVSQRHIMT